MGEFWIKAAQLVVSLSVLVILHELGHFIPAKLFKMRVEKFFLFFDWPRALLKKRFGNTTYGIGLIPLGGYVKIAGMVDESMDKAQLAKPPCPWEFRAKPAWQRLIVLVGGVTVNLLLAFFLYSMLLYANGEQYLPVKSMRYGIVTDSIGQRIGLRNGDRILQIDGRVPERVSKLVPSLILGDSLQVQREGHLEVIYIGDSVKRWIIEHRAPFSIFPRIPYQIAQVVDHSEAQKAGLLPGDKILSINGEPASFFDQVIAAIPQYRNDTIRLGLQRGTQRIERRVFVPQEGIIGIAHYGFSHFLPIKTREFGFWASFPAGLQRTYEMLRGYIKQLELIFNPYTGAYKSLGGVGTVGKLFPGTWNWTAFWSITAFLSIMLALLNILPIPMLDGGHIVFVLWEMLSGRKPNPKVLEYAQMLGFFLLLALLLYANGNDLIRFFSNR